jgi:hypothetical protein
MRGELRHQRRALGRRDGELHFKSVKAEAHVFGRALFIRENNAALFVTRPSQSNPHFACACILKMNSSPRFIARLIPRRRIF